MWTCEAINCRQYFSVILLVRQFLLCDMAFISEYAEGSNLMVYLVRGQITDPSSQDLRQAAEAIRHSDRLQLWTVLSRCYFGPPGRQIGFNDQILARLKLYCAPARPAGNL